MADKGQNPQKPGGLWARLFGVQGKKEKQPPEGEAAPGVPPPAEQLPAEPPVAGRVEPPAVEPLWEDEVPPAAQPPVAEAFPEVDAWADVTPAAEATPEEEPAPPAAKGGLPFWMQPEQPEAVEPPLPLPEDAPAAEDIPLFAEAEPVAEPEVAEENMEDTVPLRPPLPGDLESPPAPPAPVEVRTPPAPPAVPPAASPPASQPPAARPAAPKPPPASAQPPAAQPPAKPPAASPPASQPPAARPAAAQPAAPPPVAVPPAAPPAAPAAGGTPQHCHVCGAERHGQAEYCPDCGCMFDEAAPAQPHPAAAAAPAGPEHTPPAQPLRGRYQVGKRLSRRAGVYRYAGQDLQGAGGRPTPVVIVVSAARAAPAAESVTAVSVEDDGNLEDFLPTFDEPAAVPAGESGWPSAGWERDVLEKADHPSLPRVVDYFAEGEFEYLVEQAPQGLVFWDAYDDPESTPGMRYGWLIQVAEALQALHGAGAMLEGVRPDLVTVDGEGRAVVADLTDLLPIPVPADPPIRGTLYTAPELMINPATADARADVYSFGAMIYSLEYLHHGLEEKDFERQFYPKMITDRYPDVHPAFNRLILKTFSRDLNLRFPTDEAGREDPTGFTELIRTLKICQKTFERVRLDIAAWTTTGIVRTNNEDAFAFLQAAESRQDELTEYALVLLCDGMGGYEAGEVAAALAIHTLRLKLLEHPIFAALSGREPPAEGAFDLQACRKALEEALKHTNKVVHTAARAPGKGRRGMGCTAEAVYIDDQYLVVGHVGDSRTYHLTNGRLNQLTRDQTWVNRMVELGQLTEEEAEHHDRKNELQQAIGGAPIVEPGVYHARLRRGDWILVCSDGITNHVPTKDLEQMMLREAAGSAEEAARRLLNLVNLRGATDNATIVIVRVC